MSKNTGPKKSPSKLKLPVKSVATLFIVAVSVTACSLQSRARETPADGSPVPTVPQGIRSSSHVPTRFEYVELLDGRNWIVADFDRVWRTTDGGQTWRQGEGVKPQTGEGKHTGGLSFVDSQTGFLLMDRQLLRTDDAGLNWKAVANLSFGAHGLYFVDALHGWAVGSVWQEGYPNNPKVAMYVGTIFKTEDGGLTWHQQQIDLPKDYLDAGARWDLNDVFFYDQMTGWAAGFGVIFWTVNGGEDWHVADAWKGQYRRVRFLNREFGWATQHQAAAFSITTDGGKHWKLLDGPPGFGSWATDVVFITPSHGFSSLIELYETENGGRTWKWRAGNKKKLGEGYDFLGRALDGTLVVLGLDHDQVRALISSDNGATWRSPI